MNCPNCFMERIEIVELDDGGRCPKCRYSALLPSGSPRQTRDRLTIDCQHAEGEDCMNCAICGKCRETLYDDDVCDDCRPRSRGIKKGESKS